jgi:hypothetical protein
VPAAGEKGAGMSEEQDCRNWPIEVYINRYATAKIPRNAPRDAWKQFHASWERQALTARALAVNVYRGYSFAPVFDGRKTKEHFVTAFHLALDFDCGDERARIETLLQDDLINWFSSFIYYTPSSRPPAYKSRVVFVFDEPVTTVDEYEEILGAFAWRFPESDQSTTDAARFFYGSKGAELYPNWSILGRAAAQVIVDQWRTAVPLRESPSTTTYAPENVQEAEVARALAAIPRRLDYLDWVRVLMAVHSAFPDSTGIRLCESWSPGYEGEIEDKFKSFDRAKTGGVTIRTLFKWAQEHGWPGGGNGRGKPMTHKQKIQRLAAA